MLDETNFIDALKQREPEAFSKLFESYADKIFRLAVSFLKDEAAAEGVVQDTFLRLFEKLDQFEGRSKLGTWIYRVAYNICHDRLRQMQRHPEIIIADDEEIMLPGTIVDWHDLPEAALTRQEITVELEAAIQILPPSLKTVFILREIEELDTETTASILEITPGATKVRLYRARLRLRELLTNSFLEQGEGGK